MNQTICIDSGHSNLTPGKRSPDSSLMEYEFNADVASRIVSKLKQHGLDAYFQQVVIASPTEDVNRRIAAINSKNPALVVSIHSNAYGSGWTAAHGWEIYCYHPKSGGESNRLAQAIRAESIPYLGLTDRGIKDANGVAGIVTKTNPPAVLVEHGFYTNREECALLKTAEFREKCAIADTKGILHYLGLSYQGGETMELTKEEAKKIVKEKAGLDDKTIEYLAEDYQYGKELVIKLAKAMQ